MKFCPDPDCPHRQEHVDSAKYDDEAQRCSSCGARLVPCDDPEERRLVPEAPVGTANGRTAERLTTGRAFDDGNARDKAARPAFDDGNAHDETARRAPDDRTAHDQPQPMGVPLWVAISTLAVGWVLILFELRPIMAFDWGLFAVYSVPIGIACLLVSTLISTVLVIRRDRRRWRAFDDDLPEPVGERRRGVILFLVSLADVVSTFAVGLVLVLFGLRVIPKPPEDLIWAFIWILSFDSIPTGIICLLVSTVTLTVLVTRFVMRPRRSGQTQR